MQTLHTVSSLYISYVTYKESLSNNQELLEFAIISFILTTLMFNSGVKLLGEIRCSSLFGLKLKIKNQTLT